MIGLGGRRPDIGARTSWANIPRTLKQPWLVPGTKIASYSRPTDLPVETSYSSNDPYTMELPFLFRWPWTGRNTALSRPAHATYFLLPDNALMYI